MDRLTDFRNAIRKVLTEHAQLSTGDEVRGQTVFDAESDRYLVVVMGRIGGRRVHFCLAHVEIIEDKVWIQSDGTDQGVANQLGAAGVLKEDIVLGFKSPRLRRYTDFASG
jgi:hypothetical protein